MYTPRTIKYISENYSPDNEYYLFGNFLDDFYNETGDKYALIKDEPIVNNNSYAFVCKLAATAHKLANDYGLTVPEWVHKDVYTYTGEYYGARFSAKSLSESHKAILKDASPPEFSSRHIYLGSKTLSRV